MKYYNNSPKICVCVYIYLERIYVYIILRDSFNQCYIKY